MWDWEFAWSIVPDLLRGLRITIQATIFGITFAMIIGLFLAILRRSESRLISWPVAGFVEFVRSTPLLVQLYFLFFVLPVVTGIRMDALTTGIVGLALHYAAYTSEVYRAGIESVPRGQWEASTSLNLGVVDTWRHVILPQAIPVVIPALGNYLIAMLKDAPLLSLIAVVELLQTGRIIATQTFRYLEPLTLVGIIFLMVSLPLSLAVRRLEERYGQIAEASK
jgi:polar amino acid transport system permease protein